MMKFDFYADPGHGWLAVPEDQATRIGFTRDMVSRYSYFDPETRTMYLEEDCDLLRFDQFVAEKTGSRITIGRELDGGFIRSLPSIKEAA